MVANTTALLLKFDLALQETMMHNFIPFILNRPTGGSGCNVENSGATVAINDLLASVHGHGQNSTLHLFPGGSLAWPLQEGQQVTFQDIRVRGAFAVSATAIGIESGSIKTVKPVRIKSLAGNTLTIKWPYNRGAPPVVVDGQHIHATSGYVETMSVAENKFQFLTKQNCT